MNDLDFRKDPDKLRAFLNQWAVEFERPDFITDDPILIPRSYSDPRDKEIAGFFAATLAWGQRKTIINKCHNLFSRMDNKPFEFITEHGENDLRQLEGFAHRTFNSTDLLYFVHRLKRFYEEEGSLEGAFFNDTDPGNEPVYHGLISFRNRFFDESFAPERSKKHIASPARGSACKRLNMYLRWMVRSPEKGVDLGIWNAVKPKDLFCPLDVHVSRVARSFGLLERVQDDWKACVELTGNLRKLDPIDPVHYDLALFGLGVKGYLQEPR